jgi:hypothetical protein
MLAGFFVCPLGNVIRGEPEVGQSAREGWRVQPMLLRFLIFVVAPAVLMAQAPGAGVKAWSQLETRDCPKPDPADGPAQYACGSGLQGRSGGKTCLWGVQYIDG